MLEFGVVVPLLFAEKDTVGLKISIIFSHNKCSF